METLPCSIHPFSITTNAALSMRPFQPLKGINQLSKSMPLDCRIVGWGPVWLLCITKRPASVLYKSYHIRKSQQLLLSTLCFGQPAKTSSNTLCFTAYSHKWYSNDEDSVQSYQLQKPRKQRREYSICLLTNAPIHNAVKVVNVHAAGQAVGCVDKFAEGWRADLLRAEH